MKKAEESAKARGGGEDGQAAAPEAVGDASVSPVAQQSSRAIKALVPLAGRILFHLAGLWVDGGGAGKT